MFRTLLVINGFTALFYGVDKLMAKYQKNSRIPELVLHHFEFFGGTPGAYICMRLFNHKIRKAGYQLTFGCIIFMQIFLMALWSYKFGYSVTILGYMAYFSALLVGTSATYKKSIATSAAVGSSKTSFSTNNYHARAFAPSTSKLTGQRGKAQTKSKYKWKKNHLRFDMSKVLRSWRIDHICGRPTGLWLRMARSFWMTDTWDILICFDDHIFWITRDQTDHKTAEFRIDYLFTIWVTSAESIHMYDWRQLK